MRISVSVMREHSLKELKSLDADALNAGLQQIAAHAADEVASYAQQIVAMNAQRRTGQLESAIQSFSYAGIYSVGAYAGWAKEPLKRKSGYYSQTQTRSGRIAHRYRKVSTVADVGGILEYSSTRQLRHMTVASEVLEEKLEEQMEREIDELLARMGL